MKQILLLLLLLGCTARSYIPELPAEINYTTTNINGILQTNVQNCKTDVNYVIIFAEESQIITDLIKQMNNSLIEYYTPTNITNTMSNIFKKYNPGMNYPTIIINCEYIKVGGNNLQNVLQLIT